MAGCGLFVAELVRIRRLTQDAERLRVLVETSPTPIVTVNESGLIERANDAAADLMVPRDGNLVGEPVAAFLPELYALRNDKEPRFRTTLHCRGNAATGAPSRQTFGSRLTGKAWSRN